MSEYYADTLAPEMDAAEIFDEQSHIRAAQAGDPEASGKLYAHHQSNLLHFAQRLTGNAFDAEDVVQEVGIRLFRHLPDFEDRGEGVGPYLYTITRNACFDLLRKRSRHPTSELFEHEAWDTALTDPKPGPEEVAEQKALVEDIRTGLNNDDFTEALLLKAAGWDYDDIALRQGTTRGTISSRINRGRKTLKKLVAEGIIEAPEGATFNFRSKN